MLGTSLVYDRGGGKAWRLSTVTTETSTYTTQKLVGAHVSAEPDVSYAPGYAAAIGARAFALFTAPSDTFRSILLPKEVCEAFKSECRRLGFGPEAILPHAGFMMNPGSPDKRKLAMSRKLLTDEFRRCEQLGLTMINFHPGATLKQIDDEGCLRNIADSINIALDKTAGVKAVIENTAGQGTNLGFDFQHLAYIIEYVEDKSRVGVCIDTCHAYAAGYDFATPEGYDKTWRAFDEVIGREYLSAMHLNDSKRELGSRVDRHEPIGQGAIGSDFFARLMADPRTDGIPLILETPDEERWPEEVRQLYGYSVVPQKL